MIGLLQTYLFLGLALVVLGVCLLAFIDVVRRPTAAFPYADKRTKGFWLGLLVLGLLLAFLGLPPPLGVSNLIILLVLGILPAGVYLADVRPAVRHYRDRGESGGSQW